MQNKKDMAIVMGATGNMAFAVANVLLGIKKHSSSLKTDFIIFQKDMSEKDMEILQTILPCRFIEYNFNVKNEKIREQYYFDRFSTLTFSRYECFNMLDEYKKVVWLDIDILIQKDITEMCKDTPTGVSFSQGHYPIWTLFTKRIECPYDLDKNYHDAGTFIIQDTMPHYKEITQWLYNKTFEYAEYLHLGDMTILNIMFQEFDLDITPLDREKYVCHPTSPNVSDAAIVHAYSCEKFWNYFYSEFKEWNENNKNWIKMGGTPYKGKKASRIFKQVRKVFPDAPNPLRQTGKFLKYLLNKALNRFS